MKCGPVGTHFSEISLVMVKSVLTLLGVLAILAVKRDTKATVGDGYSNTWSVLWGGICWEMNVEVHGLQFRVKIIFCSKGVICIRSS